MKTIAKQYRTEAPINISRNENFEAGTFEYTCQIRAGRGRTIFGWGWNARQAYKNAMWNYRNGLYQGWIVPAIIDETGKAL